MRKCSARPRRDGPKSEFGGAWESRFRALSQVYASRFRLTTSESGSHQIPPRTNRKATKHRAGYAQCLVAQIRHQVARTFGLFGVRGRRPKLMGEVFHLSIAIFVADALHVQLDRPLCFVTACLFHVAADNIRDDAPQARLFANRHRRCDDSIQDWVRTAEPRAILVRWRKTAQQPEGRGHVPPPETRSARPVPRHDEFGRGARSAQRR